MSAREDFDRVGQQVAAWRKQIQSLWQQIQRTPNGSKRTQMTNQLNALKNQERQGTSQLNTLRSQMQQEEAAAGGAGGPDSGSAGGSQTPGAGTPPGYTAAPGSNGDNAAITAEMLKAQFHFPFDVSGFIDQAIRSGAHDPSTYAYSLIINSPQFESYYPGIKRSDGTLRFSVPEYLDARARMENIAARHGFSLTASQVRAYFDKGTDPQEFEARAAGIQMFKNYPQAIEHLNQLIDYENSKGGNLAHLTSPDQAVDFFAQLANPDYYRLYEASNIATAAASLGVNFRPDQAERVALGSNHLISLEEAQQGFAHIAQQLTEGGVDLAAFGLSSEDLTNLEFGLPVGSDVAQRALQALKQTRAAQSAQQFTTNMNYAGGRPVVQGRQEEGL